MMAVTDVADKVIFELPANNDMDQRKGRLIVYFDQNHWSTISQARYDQTRLNDAQLEAAQQILHWSAQERIIFPLSSGHLYETGKLVTAGRRYQLGLTILQLSRGWQLRDPLQVRRDEFRVALDRLSGRESQASSAVCLEPNAIHSPVRGGDVYKAALDPMVSSEAVFPLEAVVSATATIDTILDTESLEPGPDTGWTSEVQQFTTGSV
jgi:hypothetical protein